MAVRGLFVLALVWSLGCGRIGYERVDGADAAAAADAAQSDGRTPCTGDCQCTDGQSCDFDCVPQDGTCTLTCPPTETCTMICPPNVECNLLCGGDMCFDQTGNRGVLASCDQGSCGIVPL